MFLNIKCRSVYKNNLKPGVFKFLQLYNSCNCLLRREIYTEMMFEGQYELSSFFFLSNCVVGNET